MRVAFITISCPFGLKETYILREIDSISRYCEVYICPIFPRGKRRGSAAQDTVAYRHFIWKNLFQTKLFFIKNFAKFLKAFLYVLKRQSFKRKMYTIFFAPRTVSLAYFIKKNHIDHIHAYWATTPATTAFIIHLVTKTKWSFSAHRADIENNDILSKKISSSCFARSVSKKGAGILSEISPQEKNKILAIHLGVEIHNKKQANKYHRKIKMVCVSDYIKTKNLGLLIEELSRIQVPFSLDIYGEGTLRKSLERKIDSVGLEKRVKLMGRIENSALMKKYDRKYYDLLIHPSKIEGIPVCIMEAMSKKIPVATTLSGATGELADKTNSFVLKNDLSNLNKILLTFTKTDTDKITKEAFVKVKESFNIDKTSRALFSRIKQCQKK